MVMKWLTTEEMVGSSGWSLTRDEQADAMEDVPLLAVLSPPMPGRRMRFATTGTPQPRLASTMTAGPPVRGGAQSRQA